MPPTPLALSTAASDLARYAAICQSAGLVPILEPELLSDGAHPAGACEAATCASLAALFAACAAHGVLLEGCVLKPAMVTRGSGCAAASSAPEPAAEVAAATLRALRRAVPPAVPAVLFLSGGQAEAVATDNLRAIVRAAAAAAPAPPWALSFSFGRALQHSTLAAWRGEPANEPDAQAAFAERCATCAAAARGE